MTIYLHRKICPCCGQDMLIPNELTSLNVPGGMRLILFNLWRNKDTIVTHHNLIGGQAMSSLTVQISKLRSAIRDAGLPYRIESIRDEGYVLRDSP